MTAWFTIAVLVYDSPLAPSLSWPDVALIVGILFLITLLVLGWMCLRDRRAEQAEARMERLNQAAREERMHEAKVKFRQMPTETRGDGVRI